MSLLSRIAHTILNLPRMVRFLMVMIFALAYVLLFFPIVDHLYVEFFFDPATLIAPSLVSMLIGGAVYVIGWRLIVNPPIKPPPAPMPIIIYCTLSLIVLFLDLLLITMGITMLDGFVS